MYLFTAAFKQTNLLSNIPQIKKQENVQSMNHPEQMNENEKLNNCLLLIFLYTKSN